MLRLRDTSGKTWDLPKAVSFVEVCDDSGNLIVVVHKLGKHRVAIYTQEDENFHRYIANYKVKASNILSND